MIMACVLCTSCGGMFQSNLVGEDATPKKPLKVTSSPAVSVSACKPVMVSSFKNIRDFTVGPLQYSLLGVEFFDSRPVPKSYLENLQKNAFCIKEDPGVDDGQFVYLMTSENKLLNGKVIQDGFAKSTKDIDYVYKSYFQNLEQEATTNTSGFWDPKFVAGAPIDTSNENEISEKGVTDLSSLTEKKNTPKVEEKKVTEAYSVILPQQVEANLGARVVLRMRVESIGKGKDAFYINSHKEYKNSSNVAAVITLPEKDLTLGDVVKADKNLIGKYVEITGTPREVEGRIQLFVTEGKNIRLVKM